MSSTLERIEDAHRKVHLWDTTGTTAALTEALAASSEALTEAHRELKKAISEREPPRCPSCACDSVFFEVDGKSFFDHERALAHLLGDEQLFANTGRFTGEATVVLFVGCNDIFAWGCADAECVRYEEIEAVYRAWSASRMWGTAKWCCVRRQQRPQAPVEKAMREAGVWDAQMEALPANTLDAQVHAHVESFAATMRGATP